MKYFKMITALLLAALFVLAAACSKAPTPARPSSSGVGRTDKPSETMDTAGPGPDNPETGESGQSGDPSPDGDLKPGEIRWSIVDGKYVYEIAPRDDSGLATVSEMYSYSTAYYEDQPEDWYFGKTEYNEATGEVTYVWERNASVLESVKKYGGIYRGDETRKVAYLTFDCGYEYGTTGDILDTLKEKNCPGIFFVTGYYVKSEPGLIARMYAEGHLVGNHTVNHRRMTTVDTDTFMSELNGLEALVKEAFPDAPPMRYYRPPSGNSNEWTFKLADKMGYKTVMWSYAYYDYDTENQPPVSEALAKLKNALHPGVVYLLHTESATNAALLGDLIDWIRAQGYELLPICDINY
jgi:peptidoglycan-N-acetylmuramic acid deacetylase